MNTDNEQFMLAIIGIMCSVALGLVSLLIALAGVAVLLLIVRYVIGRIATARHRRRQRAAVDRVDAVAEAIAQEAGHNWTAGMMPDYRAEFRRQASAAIAVIESDKGRQ